MTSLVARTGANGAPWPGTISAGLSARSFAREASSIVWSDARGSMCGPSAEHHRWVQATSLSEVSTSLVMSWRCARVSRGSEPRARAPSRLPRAPPRRRSRASPSCRGSGRSRRALHSACGPAIIPGSTMTVTPWSRTSTIVPATRSCAQPVESASGRAVNRGAVRRMRARPSGRGAGGTRAPRRRCCRRRRR